MSAGPFHGRSGILRAAFLSGRLAGIEIENQQLAVFLPAPDLRRVRDFSPLDPPRPEQSPYVGVVIERQDESALDGVHLLRHWKALTLFLRQAGAPLDNNLCERALKRAVLHRKNALFYRTLNGAQVGDLFMGLIHTCELCGTNPFDYLTELQLHAQELAASPSEWMPWNYRETLARGEV